MPFRKWIEEKSTLYSGKLENDGYKLIHRDPRKGRVEDIDLVKSPSLGLRLARTMSRQINGPLNSTSGSYDFHPL